MLLSNPPSPKKYDPVIMFPAAETLAPVVRLPAITLPVDDIVPVTTAALVAELNVNPALAAALPALLNNTCVFAPGTVRLPDMLPAKVPIKYPSVTIFPVDDICPPVVKFPPRILPVAVINPPVLTLAAVTSPLAEINPPVLILAPVTLPPAEINPPVLTLAAVTFPPNDANPLMEILPPVIFPVTDTKVPVWLATLTTFTNIPFLAWILPVIEINPPVKLAALAMFVMMALLPVRFPVTLTVPPV